MSRALASVAGDGVGARAGVNCDEEEEEEKEAWMGLRSGLGTRHILYLWPASK